MRTTHKIFWIGCLCVFTSPLSSGTDADTAQQKRIAKPLTPEMILARALEYTGFDKSEGFAGIKESDAKLTIIDDDNTPFIRDKIRGRKVWKITFRGIPVGQGTTIIRKRDFEVILDPESGKLLKIYSLSDEAGCSDTLPQPSATAAEEWYKVRSCKMNKLPDEVCRVPFWQALQAVHMASPAAVKIIKAFYWDFSTRYRHYPHVWLIIFRGIEYPIPASGPFQGPIWANNFMLELIDVETGKAYFTTTGPIDMELMRRLSDSVMGKPDHD